MAMTTCQIKRLAFDMWYRDTAGGVFDFQKELHAYGRHDVVLLREACLKYRDEFMQCTGLDPFNQTTLASCCMAVYKTHYLPKDTLALTHNNAYINQHKAFSNISIEWLEYVKSHRSQTRLSRWGDAGWKILSGWVL